MLTLQLMQHLFNPKYSLLEGDSVDVRRVLKALSANVAVAAATVTGGPAAGASLAAFLATPAGQKLLNFQVDNAAQAAGVELENRAMGGIVTSPTLGLTGELGPELVLPLMGQPSRKKRKRTKTDRNMSKALKLANERLRTKNGRLRKGKTQADVMRLAHRLRKKM